MMNTLRLTSGADGFVFDAAQFGPQDARRGGLVLVQEIFGVTDHIRELAQTYADDGYEVLAPSLFDRRTPGFQAGYDEDGIAKGRSLSEATPWNEVESDLRACVAALSGPVFVVGYCWGGTAAWLSAARVPGVAAASAYYGRRIPELIDEAPLCPIIPPETVAAIRERYPDLSVHEYDAGHGFASDRRKDFAEDAARLARLRTLQLFHRNAGLSGDGGEP
jgi:carboxymethylenebutenolidase